jgi:hypothetical protein
METVLKVETQLRNDVNRCKVCGNRTDGRPDCGRHTAAEKNAAPLRAKSLEWEVDRDRLPDAWSDFWS